ncbi:MAG: cyclodeaminase/cyclohydrolase family protein [Clostridiales bacterium]|nr:cyclodeaminase/cyclohydrolase family protein [Clostridiales bacterium]
MKNMSLTGFAEVTASKEPVPGGGSLAALCGGLSAALVEMVSNLTIDNKKYEQKQDMMLEIKGKAYALRAPLLDYIEKDSEAFMLVMDAFKMPKSTDEEKKERSKTIQKCMKHAATVPMEVAQKAYQVIELSELVVKHGNKNAVTDGMVSAMLARTAVLSALLNVKINLGSIRNTDFVSAMNEKVEELEAKTRQKETEILNSVSL